MSRGPLTLVGRNIQPDVDEIIRHRYRNDSRNIEPRDDALSVLPRVAHELGCEVNGDAISAEKNGREDVRHETRWEYLTTNVERGYLAEVTLRHAILGGGQCVDDALDPVQGTLVSTRLEFRSAPGLHFWIEVVKILAINGNISDFNISIFVINFIYSKTKKLSIN
jgi:hypothetical protein